MKPWYDVIKPREDLREGRPLDASEFAVHLDHVRDGRAPAVYQNPQEFFERTFLTKNLRSLASQVVRRLSGVQLETSAVFNLSTQFGGGKTHALTLLYHLAKQGGGAKAWKGVPPSGVTITCHVPSRLGLTWASMVLMGFESARAIAARFAAGFIQYIHLRAVRYV